MTADPQRISSDLPLVLIVDDLEANLLALEVLLEGLPCQTVRASSGRQALQLLLRESFALMLLDVQMPDMDGFEVARHARSNSAAREVPIIFLTAGNHSDEFARTGYGTGAVDFLFKPLVRDILRSKVGVFLEMYESRQRLANANALLDRKNQKLLAFAQEEATTIEQLRAAHEELESSRRALQATEQALSDCRAELARVEQLVLKLRGS
jgi:CheY-like chemotaxis protein